MAICPEDDFDPEVYQRGFESGLRAGRGRPQNYPMVRGVFRDAGNIKVLCVSFAAEPSDDELRSFHDYIRH